MPALSRTQRRRFILALYGLFLLLCFLAVGEIAVRLRGNRPYRPADLQVQITPGGRLFTPHPVLGYTHLPGDFSVTLPDGHSFRLSHDTNGLRRTHPPGPAVRAGLPIWLLGCSFTHGWSLNNEETFPWRLQAALSDHEVLNFGVNGYGSLHSLLQFRAFLPVLPKPGVVVLSYAYFHDERTAFLRTWAKSIVPYNKLGPIAAPYARMDSAGGLDIRQRAAEYREWPLQRHSALVHFLEQQWNRVEDHFVHSHKLSKAVIRQFAQECRAQGIQFVLAGITRGRINADVLDFCRREGIPAVDISVNLSESGNRNLPHDDHPSARADAQYAAQLQAFLTAQVLKPTSSASK